MDDFFARYLQSAAVSPPPNFETYSQSCGGAPELGPFIDTDWDALRHGEVRFSDGTARSFTATSASTAVAAKLDPLGGGPCRTLPADDDPGAATWRLPAVTGAGYTLMGAPTVIADIAVSGSFAQVAARLWDVAPDGTQSLVTHLLYRPRSDNLGPQVFQLHPNGWHFAAGHLPKLELAGQSPPYGHTATGDFHVAVSNLELRLPVVEAPDGGAVAANGRRALPPDAVEPADAGHARVRGTRRSRARSATRTAAWKRDRLAWSWGGAAVTLTSASSASPRRPPTGSVSGTRREAGRQRRRSRRRRVRRQEGVRGMLDDGAQGVPLCRPRRGVGWRAARPADGRRSAAHRWRCARS